MKRATHQFRQNLAGKLDKPARRRRRDARLKAFGRRLWRFLWGRLRERVMAWEFYLNDLFKRETEHLYLRPPIHGTRERALYCNVAEVSLQSMRARICPAPKGHRSFCLNSGLAAFTSSRQVTGGLAPETPRRSISPASLCNYATHCITSAVATPLTSAHAIKLAR